MPFFRVQRIETDPCGSHWVSNPPLYVQARLVAEINEQIEAFPKGFYRFEVSEVEFVFPSELPEAMKFKKNQ